MCAGAPRGGVCAPQPWEAGWVPNPIADTGEAPVAGGAWREEHSEQRGHQYLFPPLQTHPVPLAQHHHPPSPIEKWGAAGAGCCTSSSQAWGSLGHLGGGLAAWGCCEGGASSSQLLGSPPALADHHHGTDEGHQHHGDEPQVHLAGAGGGGVRAWGRRADATEGGAPGQPHSPLRPPVLGAGPPFPKEQDPHPKMGQHPEPAIDQGRDPHPTMGQDPHPSRGQPWGRHSRRRGPRRAARAPGQRRGTAAGPPAPTAP